ncbi:unnamed protein product [Rhizophagus irregularis]|nr:unnamed protein product [Rhizophagus irregularis]
MESKRTDTLWVPSDIGFLFRCSRIPKRKMFRYSKIPKRQHVQVLQDSETENVPVLQDSETENVLVFQERSSAPGFRNGKMSPSRVSLESENDSSGILDFDRFWESD